LERYEWLRLLSSTGIGSLGRPYVEYLCVGTYGKVWGGIGHVFAAISLSKKGYMVFFGMEGILSCS